MQAMNNEYPYWRIILLFTFCPLAVGFIYGFIGAFQIVFVRDYFVDRNFTSSVAVFLGLPIASAFTGLFYFGIPAFFASVFYALMALQKAWYSYLIVAVVGGSVAHLWVPVIFSDKYVHWDLFNVLNVFFALGSSSSLVIAYFALPKKL
jgi:hypothetical protein